MFKSTVMTCNKGVRVQKYRKEKGSAWWDEEIKEMV